MKNEIFEDRLRVEFAFGIELNGLGESLAGIDVRQALVEIRRVAFELFHGGTFQRSEGLISIQDRLCLEDSMVLTILCPDTEAAGKAIAILADVIKGTLAQRAVSVSISTVRHAFV